MGGFPSMQGYNIFRLLRWLYAVGIPPILFGGRCGQSHVAFKNEMPEVWEKTYKVLEPSDFLSLKLTGKFQTNENTGFAYTLLKKAAWSKGYFNKKLIRLLDLDINRFPEVVKVGENLGPATEEVTEYLGLSENVSVFSGMQDTTACILGGGAFNDYDMVIEIGTTLNTGVVVNSRVMDI
jgi:xylulokinase